MEKSSFREKYENATVEDVFDDFQESLMMLILGAPPKEFEERRNQFNDNIVSIAKVLQISLGLLCVRLVLNTGGLILSWHRGRGLVQEIFGAKAVLFMLLCLVELGFTTFETVEATGRNAQEVIDNFLDDSDNKQRASRSIRGIYECLLTCHDFLSVVLFRKLYVLVYLAERQDAAGNRLPKKCALVVPVFALLIAADRGILGFLKNRTLSLHILDSLSLTYTMMEIIHFMGTIYYGYFILISIRKSRDFRLRCTNQAQNKSFTILERIVAVVVITHFLALVVHCAARILDGKEIYRGHSCVQKYPNVYTAMGCWESMIKRRTKYSLLLSNNWCYLAQQLTISFILWFKTRA